MAESRWVKEKGQCISCGLLAVYNVGGDNSLFTGEVATNIRVTSGRLFHCITMRADLVDEVGEVLKVLRAEGKSEAGAAQIVIRKPDRNCDYWEAWQQGETAQECSQRLRMERLEQERREHTQRMAELQVESQKAIAEVADAQRSISQDHLEFVKWSSRQTDRVTRVLLLLTVAALILALGTLLYPTGATFLDWVPGQRSAELTQAPEAAP